MVKKTGKAAHMVVEAIGNLRAQKGFTPREILNYIANNYDITSRTARCALTALRRAQEFGLLKEENERYALKVAVTRPVLQQAITEIGSDYGSEDGCGKRRRKRRSRRTKSLCKRRGSSRRRGRRGHRRRSHSRRRRRSGKRRKSLCKARGSSSRRHRRRSRSRRGGKRRCGGRSRRRGGRSRRRGRSGRRRRRRAKCRC